MSHSIPVTRREAIIGMGSVALLSPLASWARALDTRASSPSTPRSGPVAWERRFEHFRYDPSKIMAANFLLSSHPAPVRDAIAELAREYDANPEAALERHPERREALWRQLESFFGGAPGQIALTTSTTEGLRVFWQEVLLASGDEILMTTHDHPEMYDAVTMRELSTPLRISRVALYEPAQVPSMDEMVERFRRAITPRTKVAVCTWVHSSSGVKLPVGRIGAMIRELNLQRSASDQLLFFVDGVHGFGLETDRFEELGCHFFASGTHKWLAGPRGTGILVGTPEGWARLARMNHPRWKGISPGRVYSWRGFEAYEHCWAVGAAIEFQLGLGRERIKQHVHGLCSQLKSALLQIPNLTMYTPPDSERSAGIVCFDVAKRTPHEVVEALAARGIVASTTPYAVKYARVGLFLNNTEEEVAKIIAAIREIALLAN